MAIVLVLLCRCIVYCFYYWFGIVITSHCLVGDSFYANTFYWSKCMVRCHFIIIIIITGYWYGSFLKIRETRAFLCVFFLSFSHFRMVEISIQIDICIVYALVYYVQTCIEHFNRQKLWIFYDGAQRITNQINVHSMIWGISFRFDWADERTSECEVATVNRGPFTR